MIKINDEIIVNIEKIGYEGIGIARFGENKFVIFVKNCLKGEKLKVKIDFLNKKFARATILEILEPSPYRIKPFCPIYNACGSCDRQEIEYRALLEEKTLILKEIFSNLIEENKIYPIIKSPKTKNYRCKIQYPARQTKNSKRILLGYFKQNSHDLTNIKFCPIQEEIIDKISQFIRDNWLLGCYEEKKHNGLLKNVVIRKSAYDGSILLTLVLNIKENNFINIESDIFKFSKKISANFKEIKGIFINFNDKKNNKILSDEFLKIYGDNFIIEKLENKIFKIGPSSFFQINPTASIELFNVIKNNIKENSSILDAYGGVGAISIFVSEKANEITLVEENKNAIQMAHENYKLNNIKNYKIFEGDAKIHLQNFEKEKKVFDYVILDPPRSGCDIEGLKTLSNLAKNIIYVSCNPMTLKRDMSYLKEFGFKPKFVQGVDLFPYTHHIETVCMFEKEKQC